MTHFAGGVVAEDASTGPKFVFIGPNVAVPPGRLVPNVADSAKFLEMSTLI
jgi:hypothetical protein